MIGFVCELTPACNLRCTFCYNTWRTPDSPWPEPLSSAEFAKVLIPTLQYTQAKWLAFAGGEPLLYPQLPELMQTISVHCPLVKIGLLSNGILLNETRLVELINCGLNYVELSLFASTASRYQTLTGINRLEQVHMAILNVKSYGLPLTIACTLLADGLEEFEDIVLTAMALGADTLAINPFTPTGYGKNQNAAFGLSYQQLHHFLIKADMLSAQLVFPIHITLPIEYCILPHLCYPNLHFSSCQCGKRKWVIDPQGYLRTCEQDAHQIGNLTEQSFKELYNGRYVQQFRAKQRFPACTDCPHYEVCGGGCRFRQTPSAESN